MLRCLVGVLLFSGLALLAAEVMPPAPANHFNDYANVVSASVAQRLNSELVETEKASGNQLVVAIFPKMESDSSIEDYTQRVAQSWKVGQKERNNGAVLFVFIQDRKMYIQVGYGLEGALPDAICKQIIESEMKPRFRTGDYSAGLTAGVHAMIAATKGEYKGSGQTVAERRNRGNQQGQLLVAIVLILILGIPALILLRFLFGGRGGGGWGGGGRGGGWMMSSGGFGSGGGGGFSGGGSFSGGGGNFGGGGAGGSW